MAQRDKVKELVGRGLDSYHTKALQQMDRIEKKNKEQNHKISILSNELDNDYLTKIEEGSVISLEHSKEGMVYIDSLEGNTLVNYCTDGSKELTLNGDIDLEGTFVTTTEGVDNGKVDVMCEGNTLVNLIKYDAGSYCPTYAWEIGETYTMIVEFTSNAECQLYIEENITWAKLSPITNGVKVGYNKFVVKLTIPSNYTGLEKINITNRVNGIYNSNVKFTDIKPIVLKGDWTNKEIPQSHFEGMKSVGQDDENGHKIEILSRNKNLWNVNEYGLSTGIYAGVQITKLENGFKLNGTSTSSFTRHGSTNYLDIFEKGKTYILTSEYFNFEITYANGTKNWRKLVTVTDDVVKVTCYLQWLEKIITFDNLILTPQIEEGSVATSYLAPSLNKKEILLNEPLRGLPNGVKDKKVKIGNKWYIERNCAEYDIADVSGNEWIIETNSLGSFLNGNLSKYKHKPNSECICDKLPSTSISSAFVPDFNAITSNLSVENQWRIKITSCETKEDYVEWVSKNPLKVVIEKYTPTYEPLLTVPELECHNDVTHISNNSIIPCSMKIQNTGYNAIIKPSTLYTIALDTNKSGTIGMNLGGVKGTTTNNVLTLTTPATLTDDSLRLYGKGIKGSKVRLLEGDKTNWIPSHFEGMKSSFEDKFDTTDNTYKMEILSNNRNLLNMKNFVPHYNIADFSKGIITSITHTGNYGWVRLRLTNTYRLKAGAYYLQFKMRSDSYRGGINHVRFETIIDNVTLEYSSKLINPNCTSDYQVYELKFIAEKDFDINYLFIQGHMTSETNFQIKDLMLSRVQLDIYTFCESNKIQFSSIEPLRSVEDVKDRFVLKDDKLMIERNIGQYLVNGNENWTINGSDVYFNFKSLVNNFARNQKTCITSKYPNFKHSSSSNKGYVWWGGGVQDANGNLVVKPQIGINNIEEYKIWVKSNNYYVLYLKSEPTYEEIPFELQKIILEGYENGTLFFDTNIPPTSTVTYAGETPIVKATKLNKTEVLNNTNDINDNIVPYLMDMDYRVVCLQLQSENINDGVSMARLFGGAYEMLQRDIQSKRYSIDEYRHRLDAYLGANKITEDEYNKLGDMLND